MTETVPIPHTWILPLIIVSSIFIGPLILYTLYIILRYIYQQFTRIPYGLFSWHPPITLIRPTSMPESSYIYKNYMVIINGLNSWCEYTVYWPYTEECWIEFTYASMERRPINLLLNHKLYGHVCECIGTGWGWNTLTTEFIVNRYGPYRISPYGITTIRLESTGTHFPHIKHIKLYPYHKYIHKPLLLHGIVHIQNKGDCNGQWDDINGLYLGSTSGNLILEGFSIWPVDLTENDVIIKYQADLNGNINTGIRKQKDFCGNRGTYRQIKRNIHTIRIWLEGSQCNRYTVCYRTFLHGNVEVSQWCKDGEPCPNESDTHVLVGLQVKLMERGDVESDSPGPPARPNVKDKTSQRSNRTRHKPTIVSRKKSRVASASDSSEIVIAEKKASTEATVEARMRWLVGLLRKGEISKQFCVLNSNALYAGRPLLIPLKVTTYLENNGECIFLESAIAGAAEGSERLEGFSLCPIFPPGTRVRIKYSAILQGGLRTGVAKQEEFCGCRGDQVKEGYIVGWREIHGVRIWLDGEDSEQYTVHYRCFLWGVNGGSEWRKDGEFCPNKGSQLMIIGLQVMIEENPLRVPQGNTGVDDINVDT